MSGSNPSTRSRVELRNQHSPTDQRRNNCRGTRSAHIHFERQLLCSQHLFCAQHGRGVKQLLARGESCSIPKHSHKENTTASGSGGIYLRPATRWQLGRKSLYFVFLLSANCSNYFSVHGPHARSETRSSKRSTRVVCLTLSGSLRKGMLLPRF